MLHSEFELRQLLTGGDRRIACLILLPLEHAFERVSEQLLEEVQACARQLSTLAVTIILDGVAQPRDELGQLARKV